MPLWWPSASGLLKLQAEPPSSVLAAPHPQVLWLQPLVRVDVSKVSHVCSDSKAIGGGTRGEESESESNRRIPKGEDSVCPLHLLGAACHVEAQLVCVALTLVFHANTNMDQFSH